MRNRGLAIFAATLLPGGLSLRAAILLSSCAATVHAAIFPDAKWETAGPAQLGLNEQKLEEARDYALSAGGSGLIIYQGKLVSSWGDLKKLYDLKSTTKSFGAAALGLALKDGKMRLQDRAVLHHPQLGIPPETNTATGKPLRITRNKTSQEFTVDLDIADALILR